MLSDQNLLWGDPELAVEYTVKHRLTCFSHGHTSHDRFSCHRSFQQFICFYACEANDVGTCSSQEGTNSASQGLIWKEFPAQQ